MGIGNKFIGNVEKLIVNDILNSQSLFRFSKEDYLPYTFMFEKQIKEMFNVSGALMFPSATLALTSFLKTLRLDRKDEVIIPPFSWVADYSALLFENVKIRFCEINEEMQITKRSIEEMINENTKIILIPHLMGRGQQEIEKISNLCKEKRIILIEDIAQSLGVKVNGKYAGSFGDFSFSSFNYHKVLSTGDGGIGIIKSEDKFEEVSRIHDQGCLIDEKGKRKVTQKGYKKGLSLRVSNLVGGIALVQLARFPIIKNTILEKYNEVLKILSDKEKNSLILFKKGDLPYTALFRSSKNKEYPSLMASGWHYIGNIPYYNDLDLNETDKENISNSKKVLERVHAIGTGFIDKYYAIPKGVGIKEEVIERNIKEVVEEIL